MSTSLPIRYLCTSRTVTHCALCFVLIWCHASNQIGCYNERASSVAEQNNTLAPIAPVQLLCPIESAYSPKVLKTIPASHQLCLYRFVLANLSDELEHGEPTGHSANLGGSKPVVLMRKAHVCSPRWTNHCAQNSPARPVVIVALYWLSVCSSRSQRAFQRLIFERPNWPNWLKTRRCCLSKMSILFLSRQFSRPKPT